MSDRFWVPSGGNASGTWDATTTTNWSATSGGAGGASAPTSADDVYFDANSNVGTDPFTVTVTGTSAAPANCRDFTASGLDGAMTFTMGVTAFTAFLDVYGSFTLPATNFSVSTLSATIRYLSTTTGKIITTNGVSLGAVRVDFNSANGEWTLGSAFTNTRELNLLAGSLISDNYNISTGFFQSASTAVRNINLGSSIVTISSFGAGAFFVSSAANLTWDSGTSTIVFPGSSPNFQAPNLTFYNVSFTSTASGTHTISGANTFNDLTFTSIAGTGIRNISVNANQTINGTLTFGTANTAIRRMFVRSDIIGTTRTLTAATVATLADVDFRDIEGAGLGTWSGTRLGNCLGNSNITFDAGKDVYRVGTGNWSATQWALTSGGSVDVDNFPLAQDTAIFDTGTVTGTHTIDAAWNIGEFNASASSVITLAWNNLANVYKDFTLGSDVTMTGVQVAFFSGQGITQKYTTAGKTITHRTLIRSNNNTFQLQDNFTSSNVMQHEDGVLDLNGFDLTAFSYATEGLRTKSIAFGTNKIVLTGNATTIISLAFLNNFSYTGTPRFESNYAGSTGTRLFDIGRAGGATESNVFDLYITAGSDIVDLRNIGQSFYRNLDFTGFTGSTSANQQLNIYGDLTYSSGMTVSAGTSISFLKSSGTQTVTSNGKTIDFPVTKSGAGTLQLLDNATIGATRTLTHTAGTIDLNDNTLTTGVYSATGSDARSIDFGTGTLAVGGNFTASGSNYTTAGTGSVSMTSASAKTFAGGGLTYPTLNQGGAGTLTITGANTFNNITNTNATASTITFPASTVTRVLNMKLKGNISNLVSMRSSIDGTTYTIQT
jgi:hypothetical protein